VKVYFILILKIPKLKLVAHEFVFSDVQKSLKH